MNDFMPGSLSAVVSVANEGQWGEGGKARKLITCSPVYDSVSWSIVRLCTPVGAGEVSPCPHALHHWHSNVSLQRSKLQFEYCVWSILK